MGFTVNIKYKADTEDLVITSSGRNFDVSNIKDLSIEQWGFPFIYNGVRWRGLYEELKIFVGNDSFTVMFDGDDTFFEVLTYLFRDNPVRVLRQADNSEVVLLYSEDPFTTRIMIDGKQFDAAKIQNRSIDEWIFPINTRGIHWMGIFAELENYLHSTSYTISFVGPQKDMEFLLENCPDTVSIFYRDPKVVQMTYQSNRSKAKATKQGSKNNPTGRMATWRFYIGTPFVRARDHKVFSGICSGLAKRMEIKPWIVRAIGIVFMAVIGIIVSVPSTSISVASIVGFGGMINIGICLVYIILTFVVPLEGMSMPYKRLRQNKVLAGVCSGLAVRMAVKPWVVRLIGIVCMVFAPMMFSDIFLGVDIIVCIAYIVLIFVIPLEDSIS